MSGATVCLLIAGMSTILPGDHFTLAWTHSVQKTEWQEDYVLRGDRLLLTEARIQGSGAGMDPPEGARLDKGWWRYDPHLSPLPELRLTLSPFTAGYRLCLDGACRALTEVIGSDAAEGVLTLRPCAAK